MTTKFEFIDAEKANYPVTAVSRSGYYEWRDRPASATAARRDRLKLLISRVFVDSDGTYGHRRVHAQLARWGTTASPELVRALMRDLDLVPCQPPPWRPTTTIAGDAAGLPDLHAVAATLNARPRKTLHWQTPAEAFNEQLQSIQQAGVATTP